MKKCKQYSGKHSKIQFQKINIESLYIIDDMKECIIKKPLNFLENVFDNWLMFAG